VIWVWSALLAQHQDQARRERLARVGQELDDLQRTLVGPRPRRRTRAAVEAHVRALLDWFQVARYLRVQVLDAPEYRYRQEHRGRPGPGTRYRRLTRDPARPDCLLSGIEIPRAKVPKVGEREVFPGE
jgi:hypothetical protein